MLGVVLDACVPEADSCVGHDVPRRWEAAHVLEGRTFIFRPEHVHSARGVTFFKHHAYEGDRHQIHMQFVAGRQGRIHGNYLDVR